MAGQVSNMIIKLTLRSLKTVVATGVYIPKCAVNSQESL